MAGLRPPKVTDKPVPFFTSVELSALEKVCRGSSFAQRRDAAIVAVFRATGIRLSEMAGIRYDAMDAARSDLDLDSRQIRIRGKAARSGPSGSIMRLPAAWTGTCGARTRHGQAYRPGCGSG
jgi:integrase/recombinase XerD